VKLRRTLHRGIYRRGSAYAVRTDSELREFETLREAQEFRRAEMTRAKRDRLGGGAPHDFGIHQNYGLFDSDDRR